MKKVILIIVLAITIVAAIIGVSLADSDPEYKLHESIRKRFRPEWVWNEETKDYENVEIGGENRNIKPDDIKSNYDSINNISNGDISLEGIYVPKSFDEALIDSEFILYGKIDSIEKYDLYDVYKIKVISVYKGILEDSEIYVNFINLNGNKEYYDSIYEIGNKYIFTLYRDRSVFLKRDIYKRCGEIDIVLDDNENIVKILENQKVVKADNIIDTTFLKNYLANLEKNNHDYKKSLEDGYKKVIKSDDVNVICDESTIIAEIEVLSIKRHYSDIGTGKFASCEINVEKIYKGQIENNSIIYLFEKDFLVGQKYLVFLEPRTSENLSFNPSSTNSCIPISDTEKYEEYMKYIDK